MAFLGRDLLYTAMHAARHGLVVHSWMDTLGHSHAALPCTGLQTHDRTCLNKTNTASLYIITPPMLPDKHSFRFSVIISFRNIMDDLVNENSVMSHLIHAITGPPLCIK